MNDIANVNIKDISNIIKDFEKFPYDGYVQKRPNHEPTDSNFYLARYLAKCMIRAGAFNLYVEPVRMEMTGIQQIAISHVCSSDENESKGIIVGKTISQVCSTDKNKPERGIANEFSTEDS